MDVIQLVTVTVSNFWQIRRGHLYLLRVLQQWTDKSPAYPLQIECGGGFWTVTTAAELREVTRTISDLIDAFDPIRRRWSEHTFAVAVGGVTLSPDVERALFEAGCEDALVSANADGGLHLAFTRRARTRVEAIESALSDLSLAGYLGQHLPSGATLPEMALSERVNGVEAALTGHGFLPLLPEDLVVATQRLRGAAEQRAGTLVAGRLISWCEHGAFAAAAQLLALLEPEPQHLGWTALEATEPWSPQLGAARTRLQAALIVNRHK